MNTFQLNLYFISAVFFIFYSVNLYADDTIENNLPSYSRNVNENVQSPDYTSNNLAYWEYIISHTTSATKAMSVHLTQLKTSQNNNWLIEIGIKKDGHFKVIDTIDYSTTIEEIDGGSIWSYDVPGNKIIIKVTADTPNNMPSFMIKEYSVDATNPEGLGQIGKDNIQNIKDFPASHLFNKVGKSVSYITFKKRDGTKTSCTGFLIAKKLIMTNAHCLLAASSFIRHAEFNFRHDGRNVDSQISKAIEFMLFKKLDFAIITIVNDFNNTPLTISIGEEPNQLDFFFVLQHPGKRIKQVTIENCEIKKRPALGLHDEYPETDIEHSCDTDGGSSGSPIMTSNNTDINNAFLIGLHYRYRNVPKAEEKNCHDDNSNDNIDDNKVECNRGIRIVKIVEYLSDKRPDIYNQLTIN